MSYFGWNGPSASSSRIFLSDSSASGVQRYSLSSLRRRERVQSMAGLPRLRDEDGAWCAAAAVADAAPPGAPLGLVTRPALTRYMRRRMVSRQAREARRLGQAIAASIFVVARLLLSCSG